MTRFGYSLAAEQFGPKELVRQAKLAEAAGFESLWISDHFHPWNDDQGHSPFVWSVIGALSEATSLPITTAVTCPLIRIHPVIVAQAAATASAQTEGRFTLGVGTGEALNEHVTGSRWPSAEERLEMLEEAIAVIRQLWTGKLVNHRGRYYIVDTARIYTLPPEPPKIYMSGFGPKSIKLAGRVADGYINTSPSAGQVRMFRDSGGGDKPVQGGLKVSFSEDPVEARKAAHRMWPNSFLPGEAAQILPMPRHFEQLTQLVSEEMMSAMPCGPNLDPHLRAMEEYVHAGFDEVYVTQVGPDQDGFFEFYANSVLPRLR